jgi:crossover junction endodeoxyribonuclease RuvC
MIIIGIDPGTICTGFGIIEFNGNNLSRVINGRINIPSKLTLPEKLEMIYDGLDKIIKRYKPEEFAIETAFYGKNVQSAMKIGYARGAALLAAVHNKIKTCEYSPREIKKSVVGRGAASKEQVNYMIKTLLSIKKEKIQYDESDALAVAVCHAFRMTPQNDSPKKRNDWKTYIGNHPEKIVRG